MKNTVVKIMLLASVTFSSFNMQAIAPAVALRSLTTRGFGKPAALMTKRMVTTEACQQCKELKKSVDDLRLFTFVGFGSSFITYLGLRREMISRDETVKIEMRGARSNR